MADNSGALGCLVIIGAILGASIWGLRGLGLVGEQEGVVKYSDCREIVQLPPDTLQKYYHSFTCETSKTQSGTVMRGICVRVESSWWGSACTSAYIYQKLPALKCTDPKYPNLGYDDRCHAPD